MGEKPAALLLKVGCLDMEQSAIQPAALLKWQILRKQTEKANSVASESLQTCFGQAAHPSTSKKFNRKILETRESKREQISLPHIPGSMRGRLIKRKNAEAPKLSTQPCLSGRLCTCKAKSTERPSSPHITSSLGSCLQGSSRKAWQEVKAGDRKSVV